MQRIVHTTLGLLGAALALTLVACDGSSPTEPMSGPMTPAGSASFEISSSAGSESFMVSSGLNTVFCSRNAGWASLFIRFGEQATANGANGAHIDIDLCNHAGGGTFTAKDPNVAACGQAKTWDIFWHGADGSVFANQASSAGCILDMTAMGSQLSGSFSCLGLVELTGNRTVDVLNGSFSCGES